MSIYTTETTARRIKMVARGARNFEMSSSFANIAISGDDFKALMREYEWTIRSLANRFDMTMVRIREIRNGGLTGFKAADMIHAATGVWIA